MLTRRLLAILVITAAVTTGVAGVASAGQEVRCLPGTQVCVVVVTTPPGAGTSPSPEPASHGTARVCRLYSGDVVPCYDPTFGWFNDADYCYYRLLDPQPPAGDQTWEGHYPDGAVWDVACFDPIPGTSGGWGWLPSPPPGYDDPGVTPTQLAQRAVDQMRLTGPAIHLTIGSGETGLVGLPVWLWTDVTPTTWGPNSATAAVPGLSVTAQAQATKIVWDMGDGSTEVCAGPGTPYVEGAVTSPTCQHVYDTASSGRPGAAYTVTATTTWHVAWSGGGRSGSLDVTRTSTASVRIGELQVLVTG